MVIGIQFLKILCSHICVCILRRIVRFLITQPDNTFSKALLLLSLSLGSIIIGTLCVLGIQLCTNRGIDGILSPSIKLVLGNNFQLVRVYLRININICICQYHTTIFCITHNFNIRRLITFFHRNRDNIPTFKPAAIKLADKLLISCILLQSHCFFDVFIKRNRSTLLYNTSFRYLLNRRLSLLIRHNNKGSTIFVVFLQEHLFSAIQSSWHDVSVFRLVWPELFLQGITITIISMLQSINNTFLGIHSLYILTDSIFLCRCQTGTLSHKLLHISTFIVSIGYYIRHLLIVSKSTLQTSCSQIAIIANSLQSL